jgi:hypothetical protein
MDRPTICPASSSATKIQEFDSALARYAVSVRQRTANIHWHKGVDGKIEGHRAADRVVALSARPGRVTGDVEVAVSRSRHHDDPRMRELRKRVPTFLGFDRS